MKEIDITKHQFVPKQTLLNEKDRDELFKKYNITSRQLPRILITDPVVKLLNANIGDIVKIVRKSPTAGETMYYRVVVKG